jgi:acyl-CoA dehydrogenase
VQNSICRKLNEHGVILQWVAEARININAARLVVLDAAIKIDHGDVKGAMSEIAQAKILAPRAVLETIERAIQSYGGAGVSQDTPLAAMWAQVRTLKIVDGPDEVHLQQLGRNESKKANMWQVKIQHQQQITKDLLQQFQVKGKRVVFAPFCKDRLRGYLRQKREGLEFAVVVETSSSK